jgi:hypothetical protein
MEVSRPITLVEEDQHPVPERHLFGGWPRISKKRIFAVKLLIRYLRKILTENFGSIDAVQDSRQSSCV